LRKLAVLLGTLVFAKNGANTWKGF